MHNVSYSLLTIAVRAAISSDPKWAWMLGVRLQMVGVETGVKTGDRNWLARID